MNKFIIYKIIFPNTKIYVGQTINLKKRKREHKQSSVNQNRRNYNCLVNKAIRKYGFDNIKWQILNENLTKEQANMWERLWIFVEKSNDSQFGYNMTEGGEGLGIGTNHPLYGKIPWNKNKICPQFTGINNPMYGKKRPECSERMKKNNPSFGGLSEEQKIKLSKSKGGKSFLCNENGLIYHTQIQAAIDLNISKSSVSKVLKRISKTCQWFYFQISRFGRVCGVKKI